VCVDLCRSRTTPELERNGYGITVAMEFARRHGNCVLVADLLAQRARLGEAKTARLAWRPAADDTGLRVDELAMLVDAQADRFGLIVNDEQSLAQRRRALCAERGTHRDGWCFRPRAGFARVP
jgi:hypothetical protein